MGIIVKTTWMLVLCCVVMGAQSRPAFETASIKPSPPAPATPGVNTGRTRITIDSARADLTNISLSNLVNTAWRLSFDQLVAPAWMNDLRFDIHAKLPAGVSTDQVPEMLQSLLEDRFGLKAHHDQKAVPVYHLTVAKDGPKFHESSAAQNPASAQCAGGIHKVCHQLTMGDLVNILSLPFHAKMGRDYAVDRPVVDMTGLKGVYDLNFDYGIDPDGIAYSGTAAVKSLGLKLEPANRTDEIIVVDHIDRVPTTN